MDGNSPRKKGKDDTRSRVKEKERNKISDVESEDDPNAKDSSSPLLMRSQHSSESSTSLRKGQGQRMPSSRPYHPLVCRRTTSLAKDALKVTTLTFENVYADEDTEDTPQKGSSSCSSDEAGENSLTEANNCSGEHVRVSQSYAAASVSHKETVEADSSQKDRGEDSSSSVSSSCPDIEWLFCHSESDSEFSNVAKNILSQQLKKGDSSSTHGENEEEEEDSWTAIRSSPEAEELPSEDTRPNLRDLDGVSKHGAIPKQRRQGVVVRDGEDGLLPPEGEAAGVTMDLVRKMLDVFNSYPDSRPRDIKKLLVLVSLEQDNRKTNTTTATAAAASIEDKDGNNNSEVEEISQTSSRDCSREINFSEAAGTSSSHSDKKHQSLPSEVITNKNSVLHRKPAVRRRRNHMDVVANDSIGNSDKKTHTTLSGAVSYFGNSDDDMGNDLGGRKQSRKSSSKQKFSPESLLPLSAFEGLPAPAIHLATCHDDTTNGAVHCFQDERGHWFTYTFNNTFTSTSSSVGLASASTSAVSGQFPQIRETTRGPSLAPEDASLSSSSMSLCSGLTVVLDSQAPSSPLSGPPWSETSRPIRESRPPTPTVPHRRLSPPVGHLTSHRENERTSRGGILGEVLERGRTVTRAPSSGIVGLNNPRSGVPRDLLSSGPPHLQLLNLGTPGNPLQLFTSAIFDRRRLPHRMNPNESDSYYGANLDVDLSLVKQLKFSTPAPQTTQYYKLKLFGKKTIKVRFDRLSLLAILDRNLTLFECLATAFLVSLVGVLGCMVLRRGFYQEFKAFVFCVVMASSQYSLFKSVQPDAASPTHGYNKVVLYSRPVYFCLICSLILGLDFYLENFPRELISFTLYGIRLTSPALLIYLRDILLLFLLLFPLFFSLGLLPQVNTFLTYILEQVDMHIFGGNASTGLSSSVYCVLRSLFAVLFLSGFAYGGLREEAGSQHILYSIFCALTVAFAYHLGRSGANPSVLWQLIKKHMWPEELRGTEAPKENLPDEDPVDPLPKKLRTIVTNRLMHDMIVCVVLLLIVFAIHSSTVFTVLLRGENSSQFPDLLIGLWITACFMGFLNHYLIPQLRTQQPWMCIARPACMAHEYSQFEVYDAAKVMWFEKLYVWLCLLEKNILYPIIFLCALTRDADSIMQRHPAAGIVMIVVCGLKCLRGVYSQPQFQYLVLAFTVLFFNWDSKDISESFLVDYFFMSIVFSKSYEFMLKLKFIVTYIAPWQITWGSAFHAFAQPFSVPHSAMLFVQAAISAILSTPLNPILGSAIFITSYVRPVKFWERDYNTKRIDHSNTRLSSLLEQNPGADDNNLNSIFYEHLTRSLQHSLCGDILMGRWGVAVQGDCFVLASDNLNCLVHIIEMGNGLVTFQVRGLEFRGTYCQQREVEAISEGVAEDRGCCCCEPGHLPHMLSANAAFNQRWLAWEVTATKYVLEGYSISDNSATSMFQMFELRKILITYYVKSIIFFVVQSSKLEEWLKNEDISNSLASLKEKKFADLDPTFHAKIDEDYDPKESGITRTSFCNVYLEWITFCVMRRKDNARQKISWLILASHNTERDPLQVHIAKAPELSDIEYPSNTYFVAVTSHANHRWLKAAFALSICGKCPGSQQQQPINKKKKSIFLITTQPKISSNYNFH
ncbi:Pecanex-like protein 1 [Armadillidium vulgare]|nr:Pecanex-like protein 1 [Armadillidium vulgare]